MVEEVQREILMSGTTTVTYDCGCKLVLKGDEPRPEFCKKHNAKIFMEDYEPSDEEFNQSKAD